MKKCKHNTLRCLKRRVLNVYGSNVPLAVFLEEDPVGEALSADTDPLQHTVAPQLVQHQHSVQLTRLNTEEGTDGRAPRQ